MAEQTRELVAGWCAEGLNPVALDAAKLPDDVEWAIETHPANDRSVSITQRKSIPDRIEISAGLQMSAAHAAAFKALSDQQRERFLFSARRDAMLLGVLYQGLSDPLDKMGFTQRVYVEALTKTSFMAAFKDVQNALILARNFVQMHLGPSATDGGVEGPDGPFGDFLGGLDLGDI